MGYPHDEFDDVPEDSAPRGAYRGVTVDPTRSTKKTVAVAIAGILALLVGGIMFVFSPRLSTPEASSTLPLATRTASASPSASATATDQESASTKTGMVYNSGAYQGAAGQASTVLGNNGYTIAQVANWQGAEVANSTVYYSAGHAAEAEEVAKLIGVPYISKDADTELEFYIVLAADYAGLPSVTGEQGEIIDLSQTADGQTDTGTTDQTGSNQTGTTDQQPVVPGAEQVPAAPGSNG